MMLTDIRIMRSDWQKITLDARPAFQSNKFVPTNAVLWFLELEMPT